MTKKASRKDVIAVTLPGYNISIDILVQQGDDEKIIEQLKRILEETVSKIDNLGKDSFYVSECNLADRDFIFRIYR
jgi:hypothetical protein